MMQLDKIQISNFRSIKNDEILFDKHNCLIFVGDNASGKSNTLNAISGGIGVEDEVYKITQRDKRKRLSIEKEKPGEKEFFIRYIFKLSRDEVNSLIENVDTKNMNKLFRLGDKEFSFKEFANRYFSKGLWNCYFYNKESEYSSRYYAINEDIKVIKDLFLVKEKYATENGVIIEKDTILMTQNEHTTEALTLEDYTKIISSPLCKYIEENLPYVYYWKYDTNQLLPSSIQIQSFITNPNTCEPLRNIFRLANYTDIKKAFDDAKQEDGDYRNLLNNISTIASESFSKKWQHFKNVKICLFPDGTDIRIKVQRNTEYNMDDESDGFKRFISILLMLSTKVDTGDIRDSIIVIDEPDNSLSPSGCKDLRNLLIEMSKNNLVLYSTHSPFMIDKQYIDRHIIVKKDSETDITSFKVADTDKYSENEVLLHAIGTSVFDFISNKNILFEGWGDSKVFNVAMTSNKFKQITRKFNKIGISFAHGCQGIKNVTPALSYIKDKILIIFTDSDQASLSAKENYIKQHGFQSENWYSFDDLDGEKDETIEDYLSDNLLKRGLDFIGSDIDITTRGNKKVMKFLKDIQDKELFKNFLYDNLTANDIKDEYFNIILNKLSEKI